MKTKSKILVLTLTVLLVVLFVVTPAFAYTGVTGLVTDGLNGDPWVNGGTVTVYADPGTGMQACGSATIGVNGQYTVNFSCTPTNFTTIWVVMQFSAGTNGQPSDQQFQRTQFPLSGNMIVNATVDTGPTAITLTDFAATTPQSAPWLPFVLVAGVLALASGALAIARRRRTI